LGGEAVYIRHEHRGPCTLFSVTAFSQVQFRASFFPQEHLAWVAQVQAPGVRLQQVEGGWVVVVVDMVVGL